MYRWNGYDHMGWMGGTGWMPILLILVVALVAVAVWVLLRSARKQVGRPNETPVDILKRRYAGGEVDQETYRRMLEDLKD